MPVKTILTFITAVMAALTAAAGSPLADGAYYGVNYTAPFAHAYRELSRRGVDVHEAIDRDVYHISRLGLNAFRLHLWDVELSDAGGALLDNVHLELLDYLISRMEERGIAVVLTAQTNFGNGYPERNTDPNGAFSYDYDKCRVHDTPAAVAAQERYLAALVSHTNRYTGRRYADDDGILAIEINNEPCHSGTPAQITAYVDRMVSALRRAGWTRDILYNVSHNLESTQAFYDADIDGTTFQWYPTGLVSGHTRRGNWLPVLDSYDIPFDTVQGYDGRTRVIYEYDPADVIDTYLYPAAARTLRSAGFTWVTQFAYDPIDIADCNTEYQTHYLNAAYTPGKAVGMAIAAEVMRQFEAGTDFGRYPRDTVFGPFAVSARRDLATLNDGRHYYHTNATAMQPLDLAALERVIGVGSSPLLSTDGTGMVMADRIAPGVWRLEVMPDVVQARDPFGTPSPGAPKRYTTASKVRLIPRLPGLGTAYVCRDVRHARPVEVNADGSLTVAPGVYVVAPDSARAATAADTTFVAPRPAAIPLTVTHTPAVRTAPGRPLRITAQVFAGQRVDSVCVYPATVNIWRDDNPVYRMTAVDKYTYAADIPVSADAAGTDFAYMIVAHTPQGALTMPGGVGYTPLDWRCDRAAAGCYTTAVLADGAPVTLLRAADGPGGAELSTIPGVWSGTGIRHSRRAPQGDDAITLTKGDTDPTMLCITRYIGDITAAWPGLDDSARTLCLRLGRCEGVGELTLSLVNADGFTYSATVPASSGALLRLSVSDLRLDDTLLNPEPYPVFMKRRFTPDPATASPLRLAEATQLVIHTPVTAGAVTVDIAGAWLE